jgi:hypothetical protein
MSTAGIARDFKKRRFWSRFLTQTLSSVGFFAVLASIFSALFPKALPSISTFLATVVIVGSIAYGAFMSWPRPIQQAYSSPNTEIRIVEGDLFEQEGNVVIGMADTFDTETPHIIDEKGVQAQLLTRVYKNDIHALDRALHEALRDQAISHTFNPDDKKRGKQIAYPIGTVATITPAVRRLFFCLAYSKMNRHNETRGSVDGVWRSLNNVWDEVRAKGNGDPVSIAIVGGGQARISQYLPAQDSIRFIALSYMFASRIETVACRLSIVVRKVDVAKLDMLELQAFLKSLRPS